MPLLVYDLHVLPADNHTLMDTSPIYSMPDIYHKQEHSIRNSPLDISFYKMSAADMIRHHYQLPDTSPRNSFITITDRDQSSSSSTCGVSSASSASNVTPTMPTQTKKQSHRRLVRELRRLRSENTTLRSSVNILKEDLRHERESRQIAEQCHRKFFNDSMDTHAQLNLQIMEQQDQLLAYESRLNDTSNNNSSSSSSNDNSRLNDDDLLNDDHLLWSCEDMDCSNERQCYSDPHSDFDMDMDDIGRHSYYGGDIEDDDDDDDKDSNNDQQFEDLAISYLRQALISNWTSTRANLEFDDLILKHDPSPERVLQALAGAFLGWIRETVKHSTATLPATSCTTTTDIPSLSTDEKTTCVARLMTTQVQDMFLRFWKNILERYVHNDEDQYQFLQQAERTLHHRPNHHYKQQNESYYIVQNFHRLLVMLYKYDIVDGEAVVHWWHDHLPASHLLDKGDGTNDYDHDTFVAGQLRDVTRIFVEWVNEEDDDDDDGEDDDDDNSDGHFSSNDGVDYQCDSELDVVINGDDDEYMDDLFSELLEPSQADDSNASRTPIQPVERKKKSVIIQV